MSMHPDDQEKKGLAAVWARWAQTPFVRKLRPALLIGLGIGLLISSMAYLGFNAMFENKMLDWRFSWRETRGPAPDDKILIVAIDDQSLERLEVRWPWPRTMYAKLIDRLSQAGARVVAFDLMFSEPSKADLERQDRILGDAIIRSRAWIVLASKFYLKSMDVADQISYVAPVPHIDPGKTHVGYVNQWPDQDGIIRHTALIRKHQNKLYQSFALKILSRYYGFVNPKLTVKLASVQYDRLHIPVEAGANLLINFRGGPGSFKIISFENLMDDEIFQGLLDAGVFKDKIVLVGATFTEAQDNHPTPYLSDFGVTPGVEIHADILDTIMRGNYLRRLSGWQSTFLITALCLLLAMVFIHLKPWQSLILLVAVTAAYLTSAVWIFSGTSRIIPVANPMVALFLTYLVTMMYRVLTEERRSHQIKAMFSRYVSPKVVDQIIKNPSLGVKLGGNKQMVTVLFSDIRGFTTLSEQLAPEAVVELLNEYFAAWTHVIFSQDGTVDKFIGDAVMAIFGAPVPHPDDPIRAVRAALIMQKTLDTLNRKWEAHGRRTLKIGVGINTGEAIVGNMGSPQAMGYTVIGDTVNLASRLESANKELGTSILISESTYAAVRDQILAREFKDVKVKGKAQAVNVYEVLELKYALGTSPQQDGHGN